MFGPHSIVAMIASRKAGVPGSTPALVFREFLTFVPSIPFSFRRFVFISMHGPRTLYCSFFSECGGSLSLHIFLVVVVVKHSSSSNVVPLFLFACLLQICLLHLVVYTSSALSLSFLRSVVPHFVAHFLFSFFLFFLSFPFFLFLFFSSCLLFLVFFSHGGFAASGVRLLGFFFFFRVLTLLANSNVRRPS